MFNENVLYYFNMKRSGSDKSIANNYHFCFCCLNFMPWPERNLVPWQWCWLDSKYQMLLLYLSLGLCK